MAVRKQKLIPSWIDHFDLELYDVLYDITSKLGLADQVRGSRWRFNICITHFLQFVSKPVFDYKSTFLK